MSLLVTLALQTLTLTLTPGDESTSTDAVEPEPRRFRYRASSLFLGARGTVALNTGGPLCEIVFECPPGIVLGFSSEFGSAFARMLLETYTAPVPYFHIDVVIIEAINFGLGALFGDDDFRMGATIDTGWAKVFGAHGHIIVAPWVDRKGGRHGLELRAGWAYAPAVHAGLNYRWFPARLNHRR